MKRACFLIIACICILIIASIPSALGYPSAGFDYMANTTATTELEIIGMFTETIIAKGPTTVSRGTPYNFGDSCIKIDTEIVYMNLVGNSSYIGPITIVESPSKASTGAIQQQTAGIDFPADSFFDVYIEIHTALPSPNTTLHNNVPKHMSTIIIQIPPSGSTYEGPQPIPLYNQQDQPIGFMLSTRHRVEPIVGGIAVSIDKLGLLAPYIALAIAVVAIPVGVMYTRKRWFPQKT
jgi:hypothetical protein